MSPTHGLEVEICCVQPMFWYFIVLCVFYNTLNYWRHLDCPHDSVLWLLLSLQVFIIGTSKIGPRLVKLLEPKEENMGMDHAFLNPLQNVSNLKHFQCKSESGRVDSLVSWIDPFFNKGNFSFLFLYRLYASLLLVLWRLYLT